MIAFALLPFFFYGGDVFGSTSITFTTISSQEQWDSVMTVSKETGKPVFVDVYAVWCGFCKRLHRFVYTDSAVAAYFNDHFINITLDGEQSFGRHIVSVYGIRGYPTLLFLNDRGGLLQRVNGYVEPAVLLSHGRRATERAR